MTKEILVTENARLDIRQHFAYLSQNNPDTALKFFDATRETFAQLARMPGMGNLYQDDNPRLQGLRKWQVKGFKKYLIFYYDRAEHIEIMRVIYGGQDIERMLEPE
ncbi:MAG TPA: type II toxin-antitoxin system RelE/ParE family toxin [Nostocaceae cyanobacterium]|nr:type II toxin-antitoxin system RelE/ParE family toxin [Nostocaceae cyanobacterium]